MNPEPTINNEPKIEKKENFFTEILKFTLIALAIVIPIRTYIAQPFIVSGASMDPTFETGQYLIVDQLSYHVGDPQRNDVVVFKYPNNPKVYYIKRIIGLPGETVVIERGEVTIINSENPEGFKLDEKYINEDNRKIENLKAELGDSEYFVMGDNRKASSDSRVWGPLDTKYIVGKPFIRLYPVTKAGLFPGKN